MPEHNAAFKRWFGKSAIVDEGGNPLVVYHGTSKKFTTFEEKGGFVTILFSSIAVKRRGFFFAPNKEFARQFITERTGYVLPCYLSIQKPADFATNPDFEGMMDELEEAGIRRRWIMTGEMWEKFDDDNGPYFVNVLTGLGYDGAIIQEDNHTTKEVELVYVAFKPTQIKLAFNNDGSWDADDPDIRSNPKSKVPRQDEKLVDLIAVSEMGGDAQCVYGIDLIGWPREPHRDGTWDDPTAAFDNSAATEIDEASGRYGVAFGDVIELFQGKYSTEIEKAKTRLRPKNEDVRKAAQWLKRAAK